MVERKKSIGIILLGILFLLIGVYSLGTFYNLYTSDWDGYFIKMDKTVMKTIDGLEVLMEEKEQIKLRESGNLEEFNKEYNNLKQQLLKFSSEEYKSTVRNKNKLIMNE